ncbi:MAG: MlaA family lipoprotein [Gammaproteobacteria bacterium]
MNTRQFAKPSHSLLSGLLVAGILGGCASAPSNPDDPWEDWNRGAQSFNDDVDEYILKPMASGYLHITPEPVDRGVTNFFSNLDDIGVMINDLLQLKMTQAGMDMGRFLVNTTAGVVGIFDVASKIDLPKHNEDFDQTLAVWGVPSGPYLVLPFWGPSSPRGVFGLVGDALTDPLNYTLFAGAAVSAASSASDVLDVTDQRAGLMTTEKIVDEAAINRYDFIKESYLQHREYLINDGNVPEEDDSFDLDMELDMEPAAETEQPGYQLQLSSPQQD